MQYVLQYIAGLIFASVVGMARGSSLQDLVYVGLVGICDPPRPFVRESIQTLLQSGVKVKLVTGDAQETAVAIGKVQNCVRCHSDPIG
jgi:Ca2+-transporting ATPase